MGGELIHRPFFCTAQCMLHSSIQESSDENYSKRIRTSTHPIKRHKKSPDVIVRAFQDFKVLITSLRF